MYMYVYIYIYMYMYKYIPPNNDEIVFTTLLMILNMTIVRWIIGEVCRTLNPQPSTLNSEL